MPALSMSRLPDIEVDDQQPAKPNHSKGGLTLLYKIKAIFSELGVDVAYFHAQGMDLIHLHGLACLRRCVCGRCSCFMFMVDHRVCV